MKAMLPDLAVRAEWYLSLAHAFLPPMSTAQQESLTQVVPEQLSSLSARLGYALQPELDQLRHSLAPAPEGLVLLRRYSALFLVPPVPVSLNTSAYLDGSRAAHMLAALEAHYREHGVMRAGHFHDLPDHVSIQLEYLAWLLLSADGDDAFADIADFLRRFALGWLPPFCQALEQAQADREGLSCYLHLARLARSAAEHDAALLFGTDRS